MKRFDWTVGLGAIVGIAAIALGAWAEGLNIGLLWHPTAALVVFGGTLGAVIVRRGIGGISSAVKAIWQLRLKETENDEHRVEVGRLAWLSRSFQKQGVRAFENYADQSKDTLVVQGLIMVADRADRSQIKQVLDRRLELEDEEGLQDAATLEAAGGFAPTFGILGAVLGLIGVLRVLDRPEALGVGIATAFVATIYGLSIANLFFFPLAARLRSRHETQMKRREEIVSVILSLGSNEPTLAIINKFNLPR